MLAIRKLVLVGVSLAAFGYIQAESSSEKESRLKAKLVKVLEFNDLVKKKFLPALQGAAVCGKAHRAKKRQFQTICEEVIKHGEQLLILLEAEQGVGHPLWQFALLTAAYYDAESQLKQIRLKYQAIFRSVD